MSELGDVPLDRSGSATSDGSAPEPDSPALLPRLLVGLLLGVLVGLGYVLWRSQAPASPASVAAATAPAPPAATADATPAAPAAVQMVRSRRAAPILLKNRSPMPKKPSMPSVPEYENGWTASGP